MQLFNFWCKPHIKNAKCYAFSIFGEDKEEATNRFKTLYPNDDFFFVEEIEKK